MKTKIEIIPEDTELRRFVIFADKEYCGVIRSLEHTNMWYYYPDNIGGARANATSFTEILETCLYDNKVLVE